MYELYIQIWRPNLSILWPSKVGLHQNLDVYHMSVGLLDLIACNDWGAILVLSPLEGF